MRDNKKEMKKTEILKKNLKQMAPRSFGEKFGEWLIFKVEPSLKERIDPSHDSMLNDEKCEIKLSRAISNALNKLSFTDRLLLEQSSEFVNSDDDDKFDCNIQQVKPKYFDIIIYGVFFNDIIYLFKTTSDIILNDKNIGYVDKQHRGNVGEGQFHIKRNNVQYHIANFLYKTLSWDDLLEIIEKNSDK